MTFSLAEKFTRTRLTSVASRVALGFSALSLAASAALAQTPAKPLKPVTIALGTQVINVTYPWLTLPIALGYWKAEGYDVKIVSTAGSLQGIQQMVAGGVEFAQVNSTGLIQANTENNVAVRGLMGTGVIDWGVGVPDGSPIKTVTDLKGKKIGIFSLGTGGMPLLKGYLRSNGIDPDKDVQIIATGAGAPALEAMKSDRVQALMFWGSALTGFENAGTKLRVIHDPTWRALPDFTLATMKPSRAARPKPRSTRRPTPTARARSTGRASPAPSPRAPTTPRWPSGIWRCCRRSSPPWLPPTP